MRLALTLSLFALAAIVSTDKTPLPSDRYPLTVERVIDGDTLKGTIRLPWGVALIDATLRTDYDCWEVSTRRKTVKVDDAEIEKGKAAKAALEDLLDRASSVHVSAPASALRSSGRDPYGRVLVRLYVTIDDEELHVAEWMRQHGHLRN